MKPIIPFYLHPVWAMICQVFVLLTITLFIFDKTDSQGVILEKEAGTQIAYFLTFQGVSLLLINVFKVIDKTNGLDKNIQKRKTLLFSLLSLAMIIVPVIILARKFEIFHYFILTFQFGSDFNLLSVQNGITVFILFNLILLIINPFQTSHKFHARFVNAFTIGKLTLIILILLIPVMLIWGRDLSGIHLDLSVCILLFLNLTLLLTECVLYFQLKEIGKNPNIKF